MVERNEWIILTFIDFITNISFCYFAELAMDDIEMLDDNHLQLLFADSPPLLEDEPASPAEGADRPAPALPAHHMPADPPPPAPAPPAPAPAPPPPPAPPAREEP